ncbi:MAG TPA: hypothetical protein VNF47_00680 [Streptosporangiaceae bacterium]|nr:hypothetical protein [Streptosporangiaceae bacterium]
MTEQYPFSVLYDELHRRLSHESLVVGGGYSFGDRPLNPHWHASCPGIPGTGWSYGIRPARQACTSAGSADSC